MTFQFNPYVLLTVWVYALPLLAILFSARDDIRKRTTETPVDLSKTTGKSSKSKSIVAGYLAVLVVLALALSGVNGITWSVSSQHVSHNSNTTYVARVFGLESGKRYPLLIGPLFSGNSANTTYYGGKSDRTDVKVKPDPVITASFSSSFGTYLLEIPLNKVTFHQDATAKPTMVLQLKSVDYGKASVDEIHSSCNFVVHNLFTTCEHHTTRTSIKLDDKTRRQGLVPVVTKSLVSADFTLTPAMYNTYVLGR